MNDLDDLKRRAKAGDLAALQTLRDSGYFERQRAERGWPASRGQRRMWVLSRLAGGPAYHIPLALALDGPLDADALGTALDTLVERHEALRTRLALVDGELRQFVDVSGIGLERRDLALEADPEAAAQALAREHAAAPFDLERGPLLRAALLRLGERRHVLLVNLHHAVADGASLGLLVEELAALYAGRPLPGPAGRYRDFAAWQNRWLAGPEAEAGRRDWRQRLAGAPVLDLPLDYPRPAVQDLSGGLVTQALDRDSLDALQALIPGTSRFMVLLALVKALLLRHGRQRDITVGCPVAGRDRPEWERTVGCLVNTLALRDRLDEGESFRALLARVRATALEGYRLQAVPFDVVVEDLGLERDVSRPPLFDAMVSLESEAAPARLGEARLTAFGTGLAVAKFDLSFQFVETPDGPRLDLVYAARLWRADTARGLARRLATLADSAARDPQAPVGDLALLPQDERRRLEGFAATAAAHPFVPVTAAIRARAAVAPDRPALGRGAETLSYGELEARANRLARYLLHRGAGPEAVVGVWLERGPDWIIALLAVLKAGAAYLPLDPTCPRERLAWLLADAGARLLLSHTALAAGLDTPPPTVCVDALEDEQDRAAPTDPDIPVRPEQLAYLIYTSGSTGAPKGVAVSHRGLANLVAWHGRAFAVTGADHASQLANPAFDATVWEIWPYLCAGARISLADGTAAGTPEGLRDWLAARRITIGFVPTPLAEPLLALDWPPDTALRCLLTGGDRLRRRPPPGLPFTLVNNYGPTENSVVTTSGPVGPEGPLPPDLGRPVDNHRVHILDRRLNPVPVGVAGELCVAGPGLARGYRGQPGRSAAGFVPNPFAATPGERLYRTGDLARWLPDGRIDYLGRLDAQLKIRGLRIEPGEIEHALATCPGVRDCVVTVRSGADGGGRLVAYLVTDTPLDPSDLRDRLGRRLPHYLIPTAFVALDALPLTAHGKVDRAALPEPPDPASDAVPPRDALERVLAGIVREALGREALGVEDNFFALGGHSLLATRVLSRVRDTLRVEVPLPAFFKAPTVAGLALAVKSLDYRPGQGEKIAAALEKLQSLSAEEKQRLLARKRGAQPPSRGQ